MGAALPLWQSDVAATARTERADPPPPLFLIRGGRLELADEPASETAQLDTTRSEVSSRPARPIAGLKARKASLSGKWLSAIALSCILHAGIAGLFLHLRDEAVKIAGGEQAGIQLAGNAAEDRSAAGNPADPSTVTNVTMVTMLGAKPVEAEPVETAAPVTTQAPAKVSAVAVTERLQPVRETPTAAVEAPERLPDAPAKPLEPVPPTEASPATAAVQELAVTRNAEAGPSTAAPPAENIEPVDEQNLGQPLQPVEEEVSDVAEAVAALQDIPVPAPRPTFANPAKAAPAKATEKAWNEARPRQAASRQAGSGGSNQSDSRRGSADGTAEGKTASKSTGALASAAGNAAVSNYPGKVVSKLRRALRYPAAAKRQRLRGEAHVQFTVSAAGGVSSVRVVKSSGSPVLDEAAVQTVQRAAPFPAIPPEAARSSWPFTVPLAFAQ